jgi:hypothetical protein
VRADLGEQGLEPFVALHSRDGGSRSGLRYGRQCHRTSRESEKRLEVDSRRKLSVG